MINLDKKCKLSPYTPSEKEWSILTFLANELGMELHVCPDRGYKYAPQISFDGVKGYIQKHISSWQAKTDISFKQGQVILHRGVKCQLEKGQFLFIQNDTQYDFTVAKDKTKDYLRPVYELFIVIGDRKISLTQIEREVERHPEMKQLIKETFFNKSFYE